jgi:KaiC/GvpD/RAD55 family RecA-like ATPase
MPNTKRCELCRNPFEPLNDEDHCERCSRIRGVQRFFDTDAESLKNSIERYPELPITDSVEWRQRDLPERRYFLYPIIPEASITLVAGEDGSGKTMFCMGIADALAKGKNFGPWENRAGNPIKCIYFESEMNPYDFRERLIQMDTNENFFVFSVGGNYMEPDSFSRGNLTQEEYREAMAIEIINKGIQFVVIDSLALLAPGINENSKAEFDPIDQWLLSLRHAGVTIFLVDHLGKGGEQRGTSSRKDSLDNIIYIKKPKGYGAQYGCKFDLSFDKFRGRIETESRDLVKNRQFWYKQNVQGQYIWNYTSSLLDNSLDVLKDLVDVDLTLTQIAQRYGISQPTVTRMKQMFIDQRYLDENNGYRLLTESGQDFLRQAN